MGAIVNPKPPVPKALAAASVKRGKKAILKFRVDDQLWSATVTIAIKKAKGKTVKTIALGKRPANAAGTASFTCKLPKGKYKFFVSATDLLGLSVAKPASSTLTVK
jgi:flagellar hook assembly protein FlgD